MRAALLMLCAIRLQRWLLVIGLGMVLIGLSGGFVILAILGVTLAVIGPLVTSGIVFRMVSAPRPVGLILFGRFKLLLGQLATQLLLAALVTAVITAALARTGGPHPVPTFLAVFGIATLAFFASYSISHRYGGIWWFAACLLVPRLTQHLSSRFLDRPVHEALLTPIGLRVSALAEVLAWVVFGIMYLNARRITLTSWVGPRTADAQPAAHFASARNLGPYTRKDAIRMLLSGNNQGRLRWSLRPMVIVVFCVALPALLPLIATQGRVAAPLVLRVSVICAFAGPAAAVLAIGMMRRVKSLWLVAGLGRLELLETAERYGWYSVAITTALVWAVTLTMLGAADALPDFIRLGGLLVLPLASGALVLYFNLLLVRGRNLIDTLTVAGVTALLATQIICACVAPRSPFLNGLAAVEIVLVPVLRLAVVRRWEVLDWLVYRPPRLETRRAR